MPTPSAAKRRGSMVRQLSLQNQTAAQTPAGRRGLKKQLSEDDGRSRANCDPVEVTGQGWTVGSEKSEAGLRISSSDGTRNGQTKTTGARPRPVKLAWTDRRHDSLESSTGVEVVARKCQGQPRPVTAKSQRVTNLPLLGDKDTLVYTRQQLAERLRRAWREREKNRPNLDIFLAHSSETTRSVNDEPSTDRSVAPVPQTEIVIQDSVSSRSGSAASENSNCGSGNSRRRSAPEPVRAKQDSNSFNVVSKSNVKIQSSYVASKSGAVLEPKGILRTDQKKSSKTFRDSICDNDIENVRHLHEQNKIEIRVSRCDSPELCDTEKDEVIKNPALLDLLDFKTFPVADASKKFGSDFASVSFQMKNIDIPTRRNSNEPPLKVKHSRNKENMGNMSESPRSDSSYSERSKIGKLDEGESKEDDSMKCKPMEVVSKQEEEIEPPPPQPPPMTAQARRASFRSSSLLNKTISGSFSSPLINSSGEFDDEIPQNKNEIKVVLTKNPNAQRPPLTKTFSVPSRNENLTNSSQQVANPAKNVKMNVQRKLSNQPSIDAPVSKNEEDLTALRDRIKSAPTRRKLKTAAARRKNKDKGGDSSDDEKESRESTNSNNSTKKSNRRRPVIKNAGDIVTMVSLVSPAASDTEDSVIHLPVDTWTAEDKDENTQATNLTSSAGSEDQRDVTSFIIQKFVSLRKTTKTVSFQQHPPINRSYSASFPSRRAPAGTPIIIPTPVIANPVLTPSQLQDRDKRLTPSLGILSGADNRGIKRRLIRATSVPFKDDEASSDENSKTDTSTEPVCDRARDEGNEESEDDEGEEDPNREPEFKTPKEKECWILYRKMLEKGVSVSYDTVLRGMLTPTEYRLRRNQLLSSC